MYRIIFSLPPTLQPRLTNLASRVSSTFNHKIICINIDIYYVYIMLAGYTGYINIYVFIFIDAVVKVDGATPKRWISRQ